MTGRAHTTTETQELKDLWIAETFIHGMMWPFIRWRAAQFRWNGWHSFTGLRSTRTRFPRFCQRKEPTWRKRFGSICFLEEVSTHGTSSTRWSCLCVSQQVQRDKLMSDARGASQITLLVPLDPANLRVGRHCKVAYLYTGYAHSSEFTFNEFSPLHDLFSYFFFESFLLLSDLFFKNCCLQKYD